MAHFRSDARGVFLSTSLKVMFSTLNTQKNLRRVEDAEVFRHAFRRRLRIPGSAPHFLIVRNPFRRVESFYKDKFLQDPATRGPFPYDGWQDCQRVFFPALGIRREDAPGAIAATLRGVPFPLFLRMLPEVIGKDAHLRPQADVARVRWRGVLPLELRFDRVLRMEDADALRDLGRDLDLDLERRKQSTSGVSFRPDWDPGSRGIVRGLYREDFLRFGYPTEE